MGGKRRNKNKSDREDFAIAATSSRKQQRSQQDDEGDSGESDAASFATHLTLDEDMRSVMADDEEEVAEDDEFLFSERFGEYLQNATHKNVSIRVAALDNIKLMLTKHCMAEELSKWQATITELIEKALRKGDDECIRGALLAALISLQLGEEVSDEMECIVNTMRDICVDGSRSERVRVQCAQSAALCSYLSLVQPLSLTQSVNALRSIWITTKTNALSSAVFTSAVAGWALLIHQAGKRVLEAALLDQPKLCTFVDGSQVEMRVSAGEALAVIYEAAVSTFGESYRFPNQQHLLELLASLSTDSLKFRAKKDRRVQRFTFRQIYNAIKDQEAPCIKIRFGGESMDLDSCGKKLLYDLSCGVLHGGMNYHLKSNQLLRDLFELGPIGEDQPAKVSKFHRMAIQNAVSKLRDQKRAKQRDKRAC